MATDEPNETDEEMEINNGGGSMYNIAICDNNKLFVRYMEKYFLQSGLKKEELCFYEYYSIEELICNLSDNIMFDLLMLDIHMSVTNNSQAAREFRRKCPDTVLVFCSESKQTDVQSFDILPYGYLFKSYSESQMLNEVKIITDEVKRRKNVPSILGRNYYNMVVLKPDDIMYISVAKRGSRIVVFPERIRSDFEKRLICDRKIKELYDMLKGYGFVYAHNSYIVNLRYVKRKTITELELEDGTILTVARSKEKELRREMSEYFARKI